MANGYSWREIRDDGSYRLPGPDHIGWWAAVAMLVSVLLHVLVFFALDRMKIALGFQEARELSTAPVSIRRVEVSPPEAQQIQTPEDLVVPPDDLTVLLDELDLLDALPEDLEVDILPSTLEPQYALQMTDPAADGDPNAIAPEVGSNFNIDSALPEFGREMENLPPAEIGQVIVDPGSLRVDDLQMSSFTDELIKQGANGEVEAGTLDGAASLNDLLELPPDLLLGAKTLLPSDLLFEFNSAELRESAKVGLMKLALLIDKNPALYCWIEGHSDLIGGDEFNLQLSRKRAEAVKSYLVSSLRMDPDKIITRGFGRSKPIVIGGTAEEQAANRRVEIRMRKIPPTEEQIQITPTVPKPMVVEEEEPPPPKAVLVRPTRPPPPGTVLESPRQANRPPMRASPVDEPPVVPRAVAVADDPPPPAEVLRALPVEEGEPADEIPRARPVED